MIGDGVTMTAVEDMMGKRLLLAQDIDYSLVARRSQVDAW
jgi:hypothetical protein